MFITTTENTQVFDSKFKAYAELMNRLQHEYTIHKHTALKIRMEMIGRSEDQKRLYNQRSPERQYIDQGYESNGWSKDVVTNDYAAYKVWCRLKENVNPEFQQLAEDASVTQLLSLHRALINGKESALYDAAMYLKQNKQLPAASKMNGYAYGRTDNKFEFYHQKNNPKPESENRIEYETQSGSEPLEVKETPKIQPRVYTDDELALKRHTNIDDARIDFLKTSIIGNDDLPLIEDMKSAHLWSSNSIETAFKVVEQKMMLDAKFLARVEAAVNRLKSETVDVESHVVTNLSTTDMSNEYLLKTPWEQLTLEQQRQRRYLLR